MSIYQRKCVWYVDCSFKGNRVRKKIGKSKKLAKEMDRDIQAQLVRGEYSKFVKRKRVLFDDLCTKYLQFSKANKRPNVYRCDKGFIKNLLKIFSSRRIESITAYEVEQYMMKRKANVTPSTVNRELTCIRHMYNKAVEWGLLDHNQLSTVKKYKEPPGRVRFLSEEEMKSLIEACSEHLKPIVVMALYTGMRKGEILNLQWCDMNFENKTITVKKSKNNEIRTIPMHNILYSILKAHRNGNDGQPVFTYNNGCPLGDFKRSFATALKNANIKDFRFHDLRHTFASHLVMKNTDIRTVQELMGHKDIRMTMRYSHLSNAHLKQAVSRLIDVTTRSQDDNNAK
ncbi:MAG: site-specific integrase [bacterium]